MLRAAINDCADAGTRQPISPSVICRGVLSGSAGEKLIAQLNQLEALDALAFKAVIGLMSGT